mgnify:CR=1 FL=1
MLQASFTKEQLSGSVPIIDELEMQLPQGEMQLLDRVVSLTEEGGLYDRGEVIAEFDIHPDLWFFKCHFPGDPIMPGCLGIEGMWQSMGVLLAAMGHHGSLRALGIGEVKLMGEVRPHHKMVTFHMTMDKCKANKKMVMAVAKGVVKVDGEDIYRSEKMKVGIIFKED